MTEPPLATQPSPGESVRGAARGPRFVGRKGELASLLAALPLQSGGFATVKLVAGPAGIGKSRLVSEFAIAAQDRGCQVVWGLCWDADGAPPFWPWTQIARTLLSAIRATELGALLLDDASASRFDLFSAVADLLHGAQDAAPLVVVLEDLHEADQLSIALLRFLARHLEQQRILFVGTYRAGAVRDPAVAEQLEALGESGNRIDLEGLSLGELRALIPANGPDANELHTITGGNPLFVEQIVRLGPVRPEPQAIDHGGGGRRSGGQEAGERSADGYRALRTITRSRLSQLPPDTLDLLAAIAVRALPLSAAELSSLLGESAGRINSLLEPVIDAGILVVSTTMGDGSPAMAFSHLLLADAALDLANPDRLRDLHRRCAEQLVDQPGRRAERAHHLLQSGAEFAEETLSAFLEAGTEAIAALAFEDAVTHYRQALRVIDLFGAGDPAGRMRALIDLGTAQWAAGDHSTADSTFRFAWEQATRSGDSHAQMLAALGPAFRFDFSGKAAVERASRCTTALAAAPGDPTPLRARVLATLATAQLVEVDPGVCRQTAAEALTMAAELDDDLAIGYALVARIVTNLDPDTLDERLSAARRVLSIARLHGDRDLAANGYFLLLAALLEAGDIRAVDAELESRQSAVDLFSELADGRHASWFRCSRTLLDGNAELAEQFANASLETARRDNDPDAESVWVAQLSIVRWMQGRSGEVEPYYLRARREEPWRPVWIAVLAWLWASQGRLQEAMDAVSSIGATGDIPRDRHWFLTMSAVAEVVSITGDLPRARALRDELIPYSRRLVPIGLGIAAWGTVARPLGLLARLLGRHEEAITHFRQSVQVCTQAGALPWLVEAQLDLAEALRNRHADNGDPVELAEAIDRARQARAAASGLGLESFAQRAEEVLLSLGIDRFADDPRDASDGGPAEVLAAIGILGRFEVRAVDGTTPRWTSRKARELLKILVAARGAVVPRERIMDELWPGEDPTVLSNRMSVAISTVRRALDPGRAHSPDHYLRADRDVLQLNRENLEIDVESFLREAHTAIGESAGPARDAALSDAIARYAGDAFADEPYAQWADQLRNEAQAVFGALCRLLAESAAERDDHLLAAELHRRVLAVDHYDEHAHLGLVAALESLGVDGQVRLAREQYHTRMSELAS